MLKIDLRKFEEFVASLLCGDPQRNWTIGTVDIRQALKDQGLEYKEGKIQEINKCAECTNDKGCVTCENGDQYETTKKDSSWHEKPFGAKDSELMKRIIKFRGKDKKTGKWVYGDLTHTKGLDASKPEFTYPRTMVAGYEVDEETVSQFTGLVDKNGKAIFEGDIIYTEYPDGSNVNSLVGWNSEELAYGLMDEYAYRLSKIGCKYPAFEINFENNVLLNFQKSASRFEVVGTIFENPNLL